MAADDEDEAGFHRFKEPTGCILWTKPELIDGDTSDLFECVEVFEDEIHLGRQLLRCKECGQLYFYEFYELVDWEDGDDPQYWTFVPVESPADIALIKDVSPFELMRFSPRLQRDFPKGGPTSRVGWL
ncbi:MAG: hypothetical protein ACLP8A_07655 [Methylovirgula sp.]